MEIHDQESMEGFQAKQNTFVERKANESQDSPRNTRGWRQKIGATFHLQMSVLNIFSNTLIQKAISFRARRNVMFLNLSKWSKARR